MNAFRTSLHNRRGSIAGQWRCITTSGQALPCRSVHIIPFNENSQRNLRCTRAAENSLGTSDKREVETEFLSRGVRCDLRVHSRALEIPTFIDEFLNNGNR